MGRAARWVAPAALTATGVGLGVLVQVLAETQSGRPASWTVPDLVGGWAFLVAGLLVWRQRPSNQCWWLLMASGVTWFVGTFAAAADDDLSLVGFAFSGWTDVFLLWLVLAYPTGRLAGRIERVVLGLVIALFAARTLAKLFLYVPPDGTGCECVPNRFLPLTDRRWYDAVDAVWPWVLSVTFVAVLGATVGRWRRSSRPGREVLAPTVATVSLVTAQLLFTYVVRRQAAITVPTSTDLFYVVVLLRVAAATAFVVGLRQLHRTRSAVVDLVGELSEHDPTPERLENALRRALGDPTLELRPWDGRTWGTAPPSAGRAHTVIEQDGRPVAVLAHDVALLQDPGLVSAVVAAIRLTSDNERLRLALQHQLEEVAASRARIIAATDAERRRIERDLHDGVQQRLVTIALALRLAEPQDPGADPALRQALGQAVKDLGGAVDELRDLARGIHPAVLTEAGLAAAVESLVDRTPLVVRSSIEVATEPPVPVSTAAYYVVAESLTNVAKHAHADSVHLEVVQADGVLRITVRDDGVGGAAPSHGSGLDGLADRVAAAGGSLRVRGPSAGGTVVEAVLPCE